MKKTVWVYTRNLAFCLGFFGLAACGGGGGGSGPSQIADPNVVGDTQAAATAAITAAGLTVGTITMQASSTVAAGTVISQNPTAGANVASGSAVSLVVSSGIVVPNVIGATQATATTAITAAGLVVGTVTYSYDTSVAVGIVVSTTPAADSGVASGSAVNLVLSSGSSQVVVPNVVGNTIAAATAALNSAQLVVGVVTQQTSNTVAAGSIISESPAAGSGVPPGLAIDLVQSSGSAAKQVVVPNVVGDTNAVASTAITGDGLVVGAVNQQSSNTVPAGNVISQDPGAGTSVESGTSVALTVSSGSSGATGAYEVLYRFSGGADGSCPAAALTMGSDGNFYGTTSTGGAGGGTIFSFTPPVNATSVTPNTIYTFSASGDADGGSPRSALVQGSPGVFFGTTVEGGPGNAGTLFEITSSHAFSVLHLFGSTATDGVEPLGLTVGQDGNLYGMTEGGGSAGHGTIFQIPQSGGTPTYLWSFAGGAGGDNPGGFNYQSHLVQDSTGTFWGTTEAGGANDSGIIFSIVPSSTQLTPLYSIAGNNAGFAPGLVSGPGASFFGVTYGDGGGTATPGSTSFGTTFSFSGTTLMPLHTFTGFTDGSNPVANLTLGSDGNFYGVTATGGTNDINVNWGTVFSMTSGGMLAPLHAFAGAPDGAGPLASLVEGKDGYLYGSTCSGGSTGNSSTNGNGTIYRVPLP